MNTLQRMQYNPGTSANRVFTLLSIIIVTTSRATK